MIKFLRYDMTDRQRRHEPVTASFLGQAVVLSILGILDIRKHYLLLDFFKHRLLKSRFENRKPLSPDVFNLLSSIIYVQEKVINPVFPTFFEHTLTCFQLAFHFALPMW